MSLCQPGGARPHWVAYRGVLREFWPGRSHAEQPQPRRLTRKPPGHRVNPHASWPLTGLDPRQAQPLPAARGAGPRSRRLLKISARRHPGRCPGLQSQMRQDALDYRGVEDGGDDLELATAVRTVLNVDLESEASVLFDLVSRRCWPCLLTLRYRAGRGCARATSSRCAKLRDRFSFPRRSRRCWCKRAPGAHSNR